MDSIVLIDITTNNATMVVGNVRRHMVNIHNFSIYPIAILI